MAKRRARGRRGDDSDDDALPWTQPFISQVILDREQVPAFDRYPFAIPSIRHLRNAQTSIPHTTTQENSWISSD